MTAVRERHFTASAPAAAAFSSLLIVLGIAVVLVLPSIAQRGPVAEGEDPRASSSGATSEPGR